MTSPLWPSTTPVPGSNEMPKSGLKPVLWILAAIWSDGGKGFFVDLDSTNSSYITVSWAKSKSRSAPGNTLDEG